MKLISRVDDIMLFEAFHAEDNRGSFTKIFQIGELQGSFSLHPSIREIYYSTSSKNVIRGMHFQKPPCDHEKIVHVINGAVEDVLVDLRKQSANYGKCYPVELKAESPQFLYIPKGFAHGFKTLADNTCMLYLVSTEYDKASDSGIDYRSIDFDWKVEDPIVSERDRSFPRLDEFVSPF